MVNHEAVQEELRKELARDYYPEKEEGHFGPSQISGCPLRVFLDEMTRNETVMNSWLFQGTAVHHYLQESGRLTKVLKNAGYHPAFIEYEKTSRYHITDDVVVHGTCDILIEDGDERVIYDIKYSSIPVGSGHGRIYKYLSQANTYAHMFDADEYGLMMISSKSRELKEDVHIIEGTLSKDNWEIVQQKAVNIHKNLTEAGRYNGQEWSVEELHERDSGFWKGVMTAFDNEQVPSHDKECNHCDHAEYCPVEQGKLGGVKSLIPD